MSGLRSIWCQPTALKQYYPLTGTTFWMDYHLWGFWTLPYHVENVLLHAFAALFFWRLLRRLQVPGAWLAGAMFALHPVMVESVAWITERKNVLSLVLYLGALLAYLRFAQGGTSGEWRVTRKDSILSRVTRLPAEALAKAGHASLFYSNTYVSRHINASVICRSAYSSLARGGNFFLLIVGRPYGIIFACFNAGGLSMPAPG